MCPLSFYHKLELNENFETWILEFLKQINSCLLSLLRYYFYSYDTKKIEAGQQSSQPLFFI